MLTARVIPCLDVRDGRVVKGVKFQGLRDAGDPAERAAEYERQGADEIVILDVSATPEGRKTAAETVRRVRDRISIPLTVGGGVRTEEDASRLLDAGADKVSVNTAAVLEPELLTRLAEKFGCQCVVLAADAARNEQSSKEAKQQIRTEDAVCEDRGGWEIVVRSGKERTGKDAVAWAREATRRGAGEILLTSWDRDGTGAGYDLELIRAVAGAVRVPVIASGGAAGPEHMAQAIAAGADAVLAASIFHDGVHTVGWVKGELERAGVRVRQSMQSCK